MFTLLVVLQGVLALTLMAGCAAYVGKRAHQRGYSFLMWYSGSLLSFDPLSMILVLAALPDRAEEERRLLELATLEQHLASAACSPTQVPADAPAMSGGATIGDAPTVDLEPR